MFLAIILMFSVIIWVLMAAHTIFETDGNKTLQHNTCSSIKHQLFLPPDFWVVKKNPNCIIFQCP